MDTSELVQAYINQERLHAMEGRRGVINLCRIVRAIGYKDYQCYGPLAPDAYIGDLITFLEDNYGAIEAIIEWIQGTNVQDWTESLMDYVEAPDNEED